MIKKLIDKIKFKIADIKMYEILFHKFLIVEMSVKKGKHFFSFVQTEFVCSNKR